MNQELIDYIKQQMNLNVSKNKIADVLLGQGWQQPELDEAFAAAEGVVAPVQFSGDESANNNQGDGFDEGEGVYVISAVNNTASACAETCAADPGNMITGTDVLRFINSTVSTKCGFSTSELPTRMASTPHSAAISAVAIESLPVCLSGSSRSRIAPPRRRFASASDSNTLPKQVTLSLSIDHACHPVL